MSAQARALDQGIVEYFKRAERHSERKGPVRREAFKRLLEFARENDPTGKLLLAEKARDYFPDFPDYQEEAINALYDMCEEQNREVRLAGYASLTAVSKSMMNIDKAWTQQNADVLIQLLQSDDDGEAVIIKRALQEHIDLDPLGTTKILSSQCVFECNGLDEEELRARERIRTLIFQFLDEKARICIARVAEKAEVEAELLVALKGAMASCSVSDMALIFKRLIPSLPSIVSNRGTVSSDILQTLLSRAAELLKSGNGDDACGVLAIAANLVSAPPSWSSQKSINAPGTRLIVDPSPYIRFHGSSVPFGKATQSARVAIVDLATKVYETAISTLGTKLIVGVMNEYLNVAPSLYKMVDDGSSENQVRSKLKVVALIQKTVNNALGLVNITQDLRNFLQILASSPVLAPGGHKLAEDVVMPDAFTDSATTDQLQNLSRDILKKVEQKSDRLANGNQARPATAESSTSALPNALLANSTPLRLAQSQPAPTIVVPEKELSIRGSANKRHREDENADMDIVEGEASSGSQRKPRKRLLVSPLPSNAGPSLTPKASPSLLSRLDASRSRPTTPDSESRKNMDTSSETGLGLLARLSNDATHDLGNRSSGKQGGRIRHPLGSHPSQSADVSTGKNFVPLSSQPNDGSISIRGAASRSTDEQRRPSTLIERLNSQTSKVESVSRRRKRS